jgi:hypothetical protein
VVDIFSFVVGRREGDRGISVSRHGQTPTIRVFGLIQWDEGVMRGRDMEMGLTPISVQEIAKAN